MESNRENSQSEKTMKGYLLSLKNRKKDSTLFNIRMSTMNLYLMLCSLIAFALLLAFLLLRYTPLSNYLPMDSPRLEKEEQLAMLKRIDVLNKRIDAQNLYIQELRRRNEESFQTLDSVDIGDDEMIYRDPDIIARSDLDDTLRKKVLSSKSMSLSARTPRFMNLRSSGEIDDQFFVPPLHGSISKSADFSEQHYGIDIIAPANSPIKSIMDGHVISSDWTLESGNTIIIQHSYNLISVYKHNDALLKQEGDQVKAGEAIAIIGNTGLHTDGPHLHFEMWLEGKPLDPEEYLIVPEE